MGDAGKAVDAREQLAMAAGIHEDMGQKSLAVAIRLGVKEIDTLRARAERAEAELRAVWEAMPVGLLYLDPPDGGDVPLAEQVRRMGEDAKAKVRAEAELAALRARVEAAERERDDLRHAIRQHRDTFPDEPLNGELTLWAAIAAQQAEGEDRG